MNKIVSVLILVAVVAGGYFGGKAMGLFGDKALSKDEIMTVLKAHADEINASGNLKYDDWSKLNKAVHMEKQLTVYAKSKLTSEKMSGGKGPEEYMKSRVAQAKNFLCRDETMRAALAGGARIVYQWSDSEGEHIGSVKAGGEGYCEGS